MTDGEFTVKQWAIILACLEYTKRALELGLRQTGDDQFTASDLGEIIEELNEVLRPHRRQE